jgi:hypothetical protein
VINKVKAIGLGLILAAGLIIGIQAPAAASFNDCPWGQACVYVDASGQGRWVNLPYSVYGTGCHNFVAPWKNSISSMRVTYGNGWGVRWYASISCIGVKDDQMALTNWSYGPKAYMNDNIESFQLFYYPHP